MSNDLPVIKTKQVDEDKSSTITDIVEAGEEVYEAIRQVRGKGRSTDAPLQTTQLNTGNDEQENKSPLSSNVATLTGGAILLVAGAMLTKRLLF